MLHAGAGSAARYMMVPSREDMTLTATASGKGTSSLVVPPPRPKNAGTPGVVVKPSVDWIVYVQEAEGVWGSAQTALMVT